jgi:hypothetical protein
MGFSMLSRSRRVEIEMPRTRSSGALERTVEKKHDSTGDHPFCNNDAMYNFAHELETSLLTRGFVTAARSTSPTSSSLPHEAM